jgi:hypothetical protein
VDVDVVRYKYKVLRYKHTTQHAKSRRRFKSRSKAALDGVDVGFVAQTPFLRPELLAPRREELGGRQPALAKRLTA